MNIGILASHRGSNFQAIVDACNSGVLPARPVVVISNNSRAPVMARARSAGVPCVHLSSQTHPDPDALDDAMVDTFHRSGVDLIVTAGYMKKLGRRTLREYTGRIINVHPSLLPSHGGLGMYGIHVHRSVISSGDRETGATVHFVEQDYDTGPIIAQTRVLVCANDTPESLAERMLPVEHDLLIETLKTLGRRSELSC
jgi:phosphoribosylglycinamide formyltransferase 1